MSKKTIHAVFLWTHGWFGVIAGLYFALMGLTGGYVLFSNVFENWLNPQIRIAKTEADSYDLARIVSAGMEGTNSSTYPNRINIPQDPSENVILNINAAKDGEKPKLIQAFVDPSTNLYTGTQDPQTTLRGRLFAFHRELLLDGAIGRPLTAVCGFLLLILLFTGLYLWWPKRRFLGPSLKWPRLRSPFQAFYNLHKFFGIYSFLLLLMMPVTGIYIAQPKWFDWSRGKGDRPKEERGPKGPAGLPNSIALDFAKLQSDLEAQGVARRRLMLNINAAKMVVDVRSFPSGQAAKSFTFDIESSELKAVDEEEKGFELRPFMHDLHEGKFWRGAGKWVVIWMTPLTLFFFVSGVWMWWRRTSRLREKAAKA